MANSYFTYGSHRFDVVTQSLSYSQVMSMGDSQARRTQTHYPQKWSQKFVNIKMIFATVDEYIRFGSFLRDYFYAALSQNDYIVMRFVCNEIGADLNVIPEKSSMSVALTTVAPTMTVKCTVINNNKTERAKVLKHGESITDRLFLESHTVDTTTEYDRFYIGSDNEHKVRVVKLIDNGDLMCHTEMTMNGVSAYGDFRVIRDGKSQRYCLFVQNNLIPVELDWLLTQTLYKTNGSSVKMDWEEV